MIATIYHGLGGRSCCSYVAAAVFESGHEAHSHHVHHDLAAWRCSRHERQTADIRHWFFQEGLLRWNVWEEAPILSWQLHFAHQ